MANPLFERIFSGVQPPQNVGGQSAQPVQQTPSAANIMPNADMQNAMQQLRSNPAQMIRQAGYNVPDDIAGNPQATVMHLLRSGQIGWPMMQKIQPMLNMLMGGR